MKSIVVLIDYFGRWPEWFPLFLESCRTNPSIDWYIQTDCAIPEHCPSNVNIVNTTFQDYCSKVSDRLNIEYNQVHPYSICNLRPMYGEIHSEVIADYDYFGWSDIDLIYGDIRSIYNDHVLSHGVISSHYWLCSGHFCLLQNTPLFRQAFRQLDSWKARLETVGECAWIDSLDEAALTALFSPIQRQREQFLLHGPGLGVASAYNSNNYFVEQWTTPFTPMSWMDGDFYHPEVWYWQNGRITNTRDVGRSFLYLHFMNFKDKRWINDNLYGNAVTWADLPNCLKFDPNWFRLLSDDEKCVEISRHGIAFGGVTGGSKQIYSG